MRGGDVCINTLKSTENAQSCSQTSPPSPALVELPACDLDGYQPLAALVPSCNSR